MTDTSTTPPFERKRPVDQYPPCPGELNYGYDSSDEVEQSYNMHDSPVTVGATTPSKNNTNTGRGNNNDDQKQGPQSHFDVCDSLFKRRGGLKRNAENNWVLRCFTMHNSILCYYDSQSMDNIDPSRPRGRIDLATENTSVNMRSTLKQKYPTEFLLTVNIYILGGKRKWEMCCKDPAQLEKWNDALKKFDGKPIWRHGDESIGFGASCTGAEVENSVAAAEDRRSINSVATIDEKKKKLESVGPATVPKKRKKKASQSENSAFDIWKWLDTDLVICISGFNIAAYYIRIGSSETVWIAFILSNIILYHLWKLQHEKQKQSIRNSQDMVQYPHPTLTRRDRYMSMDEEMDGPVILENQSKSPIPVGTTYRRSTPNSQIAQIISQHGMPSPQAIRACASSTDDQDHGHQPSPQSYWNADPSVFQLRIGPNYKKMKNKAPSTKSLYDLFSMDIVKSDSPPDSIIDIFEIPEIPGITDLESTGHAKVPPMIILHAAIPTEEPTMFGAPADGPCVVVVLYLVITKNTMEELKSGDKASPAVKLFADWCTRAETEKDVRGRFKAMAVVDDIENLGFPSFIQGFNGKPTLINKSGTFTRHSNFIEMSINVHHFAYIAKKCLFSLHTKFPSFVFNAGFTIEGRDDEELPEVLLGGCRIYNLDLEKIQHVDEVGQ